MSLGEIKLSSQNSLTNSGMSNVVITNGNPGQLNPSLSQGLWEQMHSGNNAYPPYIHSGQTGGIINLPSNLPINLPNNNNSPTTKEMMDNLFNSLKKESPFEEILNTLFDTNEKVDFLLGVGYTIYQENGQEWIRRVTSNGYETKGKLDVSINSLFLREITIKFKNLLLAKSTLKIKI
jgi:hypothetical protein